LSEEVNEQKFLFFLFQFFFFFFFLQACISTVRLFTQTTFAFTDIFKFCRPDTRCGGQLGTYMPLAYAEVQRVLSECALIAHHINLIANVESGRDSSD
jgi:hypothetical protein